MRECIVIFLHKTGVGEVFEDYFLYFHQNLYFLSIRITLRFTKDPMRWTLNRIFRTRPEPNPCEQRLNLNIDFSKLAQL